MWSFLAKALERLVRGLAPTGVDVPQNSKSRSFFIGAGGGGRSAVSRASMVVPLSRRGGRTQTQLPSLFRPFDPLTNLNKKRKLPFQLSSFWCWWWGSNPHEVAFAGF